MGNYTGERLWRAAAGAALTAEEKRAVRAVLAGRFLQATAEATGLAAQTVRSRLTSALAKAAVRNAARGCAAATRPDDRQPR